MPSITLRTSYKSNSDLLLNPSELRDLYLFGINIVDQNNVALDDKTFEFYIRAAMHEMEEYLNLKLKKQVIDETIQFQGSDFLRWGYIKTSYQVTCPISLQGFFNSTKQIEYPSNWLSYKKSSDGKLYERNIYIVPSGDATTHSQALTLTGVIPQLGYLGWRNIPNYWKCVYVTGFDKVPESIVNAVGKLASIGLFNIGGDLVIGAGIASMSLGMDGFSQSINTTSSAENSAYSARITMYQKELKVLLPKLKDFYRGFSFGVF